nr:TraB/GumN family protein [Paraburkholderia aromaticivorans]
MPVKKAFAEATFVVFELDLDAPVDPSPMFLPSGMKLSQILPATTYERAVGHWLNLGLPRERIDMLKPAIVAITSQMTAASKNGYSTDLGVDRHFWDRATRDVKSRDALETIADQMTAMTAAPNDEQISLLDYLLHQDDVGSSEISSMVASWSRGDIGFFEQMAMERRHRWPQAFSVLLDKRNESWMPKSWT